MKMLDVCRATIYRMADRGELDLVKIGARATRVTAASIERAIGAKTRRGKQPKTPREMCRLTLNIRRSRSKSQSWRATLLRFRKLLQK